MSTITAPVITEPTLCSRKYLTEESKSVQTSSKTIGVGNALVQLAPVKEEWEHDLDVDEFKLKRRAFQEQEAAWKENKAKCYYLVLSHCPKEFEQELWNSTKWAATEADQDMVALLLMIRDITHNKKEWKESVMTTVESNIELFTIIQEPGQDLDSYYKAFKAQVDTINAHGGNAG